MSKKINPKDNSSNQQNKNAVTSGVNKQHQQVQTNKDNQKKGK